MQGEPPQAMFHAVAHGEKNVLVFLETAVFINLYTWHSCIKLNKFWYVLIKAKIGKGKCEWLVQTQEFQLVEQQNPPPSI